MTEQQIQNATSFVADIGPRTQAYYLIRLCSDGSYNSLYAGDKPHLEVIQKLFAEFCDQAFNGKTEMLPPTHIMKT